jgi:GNAT superfamily N-acetyltransferase
MSFVVREATLADCEAIGKIQAQTWKTTYKNILTDNFLSTIDESERAQAAIKRHSNPDIKTFVIAMDTTGLPVGFICMGPSREQNLIADVEVYAIYVLDEHQKLGLGELLLRRALDYLKSQNGKLAFISVFKNNFKARRFYEKMGGQFIGEDCAVIDEVQYETATYIWDLSKPLYSLGIANNKDIPEIRKLVNSAYKELADIGLNYTATYQDENETKERMSQGRCLVLRDSTRIVATILFYEKNYFTCFCLKCFLKFSFGSWGIKLYLFHLFGIYTCVIGIVLSLVPTSFI